MNKKLAVIAAVGAISVISMFTVACGGDNNGNSDNVDKTYTITLDANGGTLVGESTVKTGNDGKISEANFPVDPTHITDIFEGWYTNASGGDRIDTSYVFTADDTIYAHWTAPVTDVELESDVVSAEEWLAAWSFAGVNNVTICGNYVGMGTAVYKWAVDKHEFESVYEEEYSEANEHYYEEYGDTYAYRYSYNKQTQKWTKEKTESSGLQVTSSLSGLDNDVAPYFEKFDYNTELKAYVGTYASSGHGQMTVTVKIKDGDLRYFKCEGADLDIMYCTEVEFALDYGDTVIELPNVAEIKRLSLSCSSPDRYKELCDKFEAAYSNENVRLEINIISGNSEICDVIYTDSQNLQAPGGRYAALSAENARAVKSGCTDIAVATVTYGDDIYGFPVDLCNTYFMWYDPTFFTETDVLSLNTMSQKALSQKKYIAFPYNDMYYASAFFRGTGCTFGYDGNGNYTADISGDKGKNAVLAMLGLYGIQSPTRDVFYDSGNGPARNDTVAYFGGSWSAANVPKHFVTAVCPKFSANETEYVLMPTINSMCFAVNSRSGESEMAEELAAYLSSAMAQKYYNDESLIEIPANKEVLEAVRAQITADVARNAVLSQIESGAVPQGIQAHEYYEYGMVFLRNIYNGMITETNVESKLEELYRMLNNCL